MSGNCILYDISRLITRFSRVVPNGIDRVDFGYAEHFLGRDASRNRGVLFGGLGPRAIDPEPAQRVVRAVAKHWRETDSSQNDEGYRALKKALENSGPSLPGPVDRHRDWRKLRSSVGTLFENGSTVGWNALWPGRDLASTAPRGAVYLNTSQFPAWVDWYFGWLKSRPDVKVAFFLHDLLPIELPEFFPPSEANRHERRLDVIARYASGVIVASDETRTAFVNHLRKTGRTPPPICVLPLPPAPQFIIQQDHDSDLERHTYFVALGTIEPRKNHLLLLQLWRELARRLSTATPKLVLVGLRGWDNENVLDMLDRCDLIRPHVIESGGLSTSSLRRVLAGARALLMPSFAEGYGLPVVEAIAAGASVIASDVPSFKDFDDVIRLDPTDGPAWMAAILSHMGGPQRRGAPRSTGLPAGMDWPLHLRHAKAFLKSL